MIRNSQMLKDRELILSVIIASFSSFLSRIYYMSWVGIIDTNAYIIGENPDKNVDIQGLFPVTSIINHSCMPNTICFAREDYSFTCRAVTDIQEGEELTTNYLYHQYHFFGHSYRAEELQDFWHFSCTCVRCGDRSELGTMSDSLLCTACMGGVLTPPGRSTTCATPRWECRECGEVTSDREVNNRINHWWNIIQEADTQDTNLCLNLVEQLSRLFHHNHYYILEMKRRVVENIGRTSDPTPALLERSVRYCEDHLRIQTTLAPGLSEYRAYTSNNMARALYCLTRKQDKDKQMKEKDVLEAMARVCEYLVVVITIWGPYRSGSQEKIIADEASTFLKQVQRNFLNKR